jgi:hypothetical protein
VTMLSGIRFGAQIEAAAKAHGLQPRLLAAVAAQETGGPGSNSGANIVGDHGHGRGLFQIDDRWHAFATTPAAMDPAKNADYAAGMLSGLIAKYGGVKQALSAYNAGSPNATGTVTTWADGSRLGYADSVLRHYADLGGDVQALGGELAAGRDDASPAANALSGLASAATGGASGALAAGAGSAVGAAVGGGTAGVGAANAGSAAAGVPLANFEVTLPQPSPYPSQYRSYTSVSGMDSNGPQQVDAMMAGLIDGVDGVTSQNDGS